MKIRHLLYSKMVLFLAVMLTALIPMRTALGNDGAGLPITPDLTVRWWQWALSIPASVHPLTEKATDPDGSKYCMVGQQGNDWFLGGTFKVVDVSPEMSSAQSADQGGIPTMVVERQCEIPLGKSILIPVINAECSTAEELDLDNPVPANLFARVRYLRNCARDTADAIDPHTATAHFGPVKAKDKWSKSPVAIERVSTVIPFSVTFPPDNVLMRDCPDGPDAYLCDPDPNPSLAQADGYWARVLPPEPGRYKLETYGAAPPFDFALRITYELTVVGPEKQ